MEFNLLVIALAAIVPMVTGFIWYNPKVMGAAWMREAGLTEDQLKGGNMGMIFGLSYVFSFLLALGISSIVVHQYHVQSILMNEPGITEQGSDINLYFMDFLSKYGENFRTFKHGVLHGFIASVLVVLPILATNAMFERKSFKYIWINTGYWAITISLMGGVLCQWL